MLGPVIIWNTFSPVEMEEQLLFPFPHTLQTCELTSDQVDIIGNEGNIVLHLQTGMSSTFQNNVPHSWA